MKLDLLTNATVVDDAIKFVLDRSNEKMKSATSTNKDDKHEVHQGYDKLCMNNYVSSRDILGCKLTDNL
jgi:hypothetical protein